MSRRERNLAITVAALVLLWGGSIGLSRYEEALERNEQLEFNTNLALSDAKAAELRGLNAQGKLVQWQKQSLPTNIDLAKTLYQDWLRKQLDDSFMIVKEIDERSPRASRNNYQQVTFVVIATGSLSKFTEFLYSFYESNHLHRISEATLVPTSSRKSLTVTLTVDALILPECDRTDTLAEGKQDTFADSLNDIDKELKSRDIFAVYEPPQPEEPEVDPMEEEPEPEVVVDTPDKEAASAYLSGITRGALGYRLSIRMQNSGKLYYFNPGDRVEIGRFSATVVELDGRRVVLEGDQGQLELTLGQNLTQARELSREADSESETEAS